MQSLGVQTAGRTGVQMVAENEGEQRGVETAELEGADSAGEQRCRAHECKGVKKCRAYWCRGHRGADGCRE